MSSIYKSQSYLKILSEYDIKQTIGKGTFSIVKLGIKKSTQEKVAIKILEKSKIINKEDLQRVKREITLLKNFSHRNIIKIYDIYQDLEKHYIIMEYCENGELFNYIVNKQKLNDKEASFFYYQLIEGLEYIHSKGVVHRDLKPENLLIGKGDILKIIDFGLSNYYNNNCLLKTPCGSPCYASPEMVSGKKYNGFNNDIWSTGIILFAMICGYLPFEDSDNRKLFKKIINCNVNYPPFISSFAKNLIKRILVNDPNKRIKISEIQFHPFYIQGKNLFKIKHPEFFQDDFNYDINYKINNYISFTDRSSNNDKNLLLNEYRKRSATEKKKKMFQEKIKRPITSKPIINTQNIMNIDNKGIQWKSNSKDRDNIKLSKSLNNKKINPNIIKSQYIHIKNPNNLNNNNIKTKTIRSFTIGNSNTKELSPEKLLEEFHRKQKINEIYPKKQNYIRASLKINTDNFPIQDFMDFSLSNNILKNQYNLTQNEENKIRFSNEIENTFNPKKQIYNRIPTNYELYGGIIQNRMKKENKVTPYVNLVSKNIHQKIMKSILNLDQTNPSIYNPTKYNSIISKQNSEKNSMINKIKKINTFNLNNNIINIIGQKFHNNGNGNQNNNSGVYKPISSRHNEIYKIEPKFDSNDYLKSKRIISYISDLGNNKKNGKNNCSISERQSLELSKKIKQLKDNLDTFNKRENSNIIDRIKKQKAQLINNNEKIKVKDLYLNTDTYLQKKKQNINYEKKYVPFYYNNDYLELRKTLNYFDNKRKNIQSSI